MSRQSTRRRQLVADNPVSSLDIRIRMCFMGTVLACCAAVICWRLVDLQRIQRDRWLTVAAKQYRTGVKVQGARGSIYDRNGRALAVSVEALAVGAHPRRWNGTIDELASLSEIVGRRPSNLLKQLSQDKSFLWLARSVATRHRPMLRRIAPRGLSVFSEFRRYYPQGELAGSLLGAVGRDGSGLSGIELVYNKRLRAASFDVSLRRDALGNFLTPAAWKGSSDLPRERGESELRHEGNHIVLSIDAAVQGILEREFRRGAEHAAASRVFGMVMDAETGNILALAQSEHFNPNRHEALSPSQLRNVVVQDAFEPGSTIKPLVAAAALDDGLVGANEMLDCENGRYRVGRHTIHDVHRIEVVPLREVLVQSSNICMAKLGQRLGRRRLHEAMAEFGFGRETGIELQGEGKGILRPLSRWRPIDEATASFGQGVAVTAVQLVQAYAALANGGILVQPTLIRSEAPRSRRRVLTEETALRISEMIRGVVHDEHGTARKAGIAGVTVHGKTGTAQKALKNGRGYDPENVLSSFIGYLDGAEVGVNKKLVMLVVVDEPQVRPRWGGTVAAPVFRRSMERILSHLLTSQGGVRTAAAMELSETVG